MSSTCRRNSLDARPPTYIKMTDFCGSGLFAGVTIQRVYWEANPCEMDNDSLYIMQAGSGRNPIFLDAADSKAHVAGNINHACRPNAEVQKWTTMQGLNRLIIVATEEISKDKEITIDYGRGRDQPSRSVTPSVHIPTPPSLRRLPLPPSAELNEFTRPSKPKFLAEPRGKQPLLTTNSRTQLVEFLTGTLAMNPVQDFLFATAVMDPKCCVGPHPATTSPHPVSDVDSVRVSAHEENNPPPSTSRPLDLFINDMREEPPNKFIQQVLVSSSSDLATGRMAGQQQ
ncbi:hypothetical protein B0H14DRAFT_2647115 [Mycena olivaceomarginata]|nr:hypothetical protein B0H14DRAFT_2647115 [Mycena olivaceomarginata]